MNWVNAVQEMMHGNKMHRSGMNNDFLICHGNVFLRGSYIGETNLTQMRRYMPTSRDISAEDWINYKRNLPSDDWEGCDSPDGRFN